MIVFNALIACDVHIIMQDGTIGDRVIHPDRDVEIMLTINGEIGDGPCVICSGIRCRRRIEKGYIVVIYLRYGNIRGVHVACILIDNGIHKILASFNGIWPIILC